MGKTAIKYFYISKSNHWVGSSNTFMFGLCFEQYYFLFVYSNNPIKKNLCGKIMEKVQAEFYLEGLK